MVKIAVLASFNMDLVMRTERRPDAGETLQCEFSMFLGGKGFNQAVAARRLGADVVVTGASATTNSAASSSTRWTARASTASAPSSLT